MTLPVIVPFCAEADENRNKRVNWIIKRNFMALKYSKFVTDKHYLIVLCMS
jgi:hypothetical protein